MSLGIFGCIAQSVVDSGHAHITLTQTHCDNNDPLSRLILKQGIDMSQMGRHQALRKDVELALKKLPKGTPQYYHMRRYIMLTLITDLKTINRLVPQLGSLRNNIIDELVMLWQRRGNCTKTILSKVSIIRQVCRAHCPDLTLPTNQALGLKLEQNKRTKIQHWITPEQVVVPAIRQLCTLQYHFGLTKQEALQVRSYMFQGTQLRLPRKITYNHYDRSVPIQSELQRHQQSIIAMNPVFIQRRSRNELQALSEQFRQQLEQIGIIDENYYRHYYIKSRYEFLQQIGLKPRALFQQLREETGYRSNRPLMEILKCLSDY